MKRIYAIPAALAALALSASAQDAPLATQVKIMGLQGAVMGKTVKGAPYSGTEISETTQTLGDGTRIHNLTQTQVFRDSEGRVRRESGDIVTIYDPVANASYSLDTKTQTAHKLPLGTYFFRSTSDGSTTHTQSFRFTTDEQIVSNQTEGKAKARLDEMKIQLDEAMVSARAIGFAAKGNTGESLHTESLGKRMLEGVNADGSRATSTIPAGTIGNDRPIQSVTERWYSSDLQTFIQTRHSDPRTGEETFRLTDIVRSEPPAYLFQVPAGYQIQTNLKNPPPLP
jgi:hypothetical protein